MDLQFVRGVKRAARCLRTCPGARQQRHSFHLDGWASNDVTASRKKISVTSPIAAPS
jgi:hypothetical protein